MYSALLVADEEGSITISSQLTANEKNQQQKEEDIEELQLIEDIRHTVEQRRRSHGSVIITDSDETDSIDSDSDSPFMSDGEAIPCYDEYQSDRKNPRSGPVKLYLKEQLSNWPKYHYKKYRLHYMEKHGIQMNYGSIHTKAIKYSLKNEKIQRKQDENSCIYIENMMEDLPKYKSFLSLDSQNPIQSIQKDRTLISPIKTKENEQENRKSPSKLHKMKNKFKKTLKQTKSYTNHLTIAKEQVPITSDTTDDEQLQNSTKPSNKI